MIITAMFENIETGDVETTAVECQNYTAGFEQLKRTQPEGGRLVSVRPER
ncbi:hypothetical protein SAMN04489740_0837 [Arthrobacter alpinus]|uniref:Uncharacterized protein n=1 Tax=Arthrobacter alpinus TaxID=656366 RepID=A0A1H5GU70_9MICC|nr:hypothetical protein [Arthrobacter alpinus]SEE18598.1 hypothetical protein SAMN04489740_0837 [Arthrobacter alpinus]